MDLARSAIVVALRAWRANTQPPAAVAPSDCEKLCEERGFEVIWDKLGQGDSATAATLFSPPRLSRRSARSACRSVPPRTARAKSRSICRRAAAVLKSCASQGAASAWAALDRAADQ